MTLLKFRSRAERSGIAALLGGYSIEVTPRTAAKIEDFRALLPAGTRVYIAHIDGTPIEDMIATAARLAADGFEVMPHFPARLIADAATLKDWIARYQEAAQVTQGLILAGGIARPRGAFHSSMQLLETGLFDRAGFERLHVAGHPEGCRDIDPDGSDRAVTEALRWKAGFAERSDAQMALVTQFAFETAPILAWMRRLGAEGIALPVHLGLSGPAKLKSLIRFAALCGVGPSARVLQKRARDLTRFMLPYSPAAMIAELAAARSADPPLPLEQLHLFPLGGLAATATWANAQSGTAPHLAQAV